MSTVCGICKGPLLDEQLEVLPATLRHMDCGGDCLSCILDCEHVTYWVHHESNCVFLLPDGEEELSIETEEIFKDQFFELVANGYSYTLDR